MFGQSRSPAHTAVPYGNSLAWSLPLSASGLPASFNEATFSLILAVGMRSPHGRLLDQQSLMATMAKRAALVKDPSAYAHDASYVAECGRGGTAGSRGE